jgi:hypothetical protein
MMDFFTRCWKKMHPKRAVLCFCACLWLSNLSAVWAQSTLVEINQMQMERNESGVVFSANLKFELPSLVEDALHKGIPMFFVAEIEVLRDRWYWSDKAVASQARYMRLAYQPLTRRWRLNVGPSAMGNSGLGVALNQNFESLADALAHMQRFSRWRIADATDVEFDGKTHAEFSFRLDISQLPRPFQIGAMGQSEWNLSGSRNLRLLLDNTK